MLLWQCPPRELLAQGDWGFLRLFCPMPKWKCSRDAIQPDCFGGFLKIERSFQNKILMTDEVGLLKSILAALMQIATNEDLDESTEKLRNFLLKCVPQS